MDQPPPAALPARQPGAHKGDHGIVVIVGGSATMPGAAAIAARAAFRAGAGLVKIAASSKTLAVALAIEPGATGLALTGARENWEKLLGARESDQRAVLAVGPGLGQRKTARQWVADLLDNPRRLLLDADGLNALACLGGALAGRRPPATTILTPHPGEYRRLADALKLNYDPTAPDKRDHAVKALARVHASVVVLKGARTLVSDGERIWRLETPGSALLGTAGTGDVLTGCMASLWAQGMEPFDAACLAVWAGCRAAEQWEVAHGPRGMLARELADALPAQFTL